MNLIRSHIPKAKVIENQSSELTFQLPDDKQSVAKFEKLFADIDDQIVALGISGYGISNTTLEEVSTHRFTAYTVIYFVVLKKVQTEIL